MIAYALFGVAWLATSPPWSSPDEPAALAKGLDVARGHFLGGKPDYQFGASSFIEQWYRQLTRTVDLPTGQVPPALIPCFAFDSRIDASCLSNDPVEPFSTTPVELANHDPVVGEAADIRLLVARLAIQGSAVAPERVDVTYIGTYQPFVYGISAVPALPASDSTAALYLARSANLVGCLALLGLGLRLTGRTGGSVRWFGVSLALTPMLLFCAGTLSSSGPELAAAFCHVTALLEWHREKRLSTPVRRALLVSGVVLALARTLGPLWVVLFDLSAAVVLGGPARGLFQQRIAKRWLVTYLIAIGASMTVSLAWQAIVQPRTADHIQFGTFVRRAFGEFGGQFDQQVGVFGWLDTYLPAPIYRVWAILGLMLLVAGLAAASWSGRALLALVSLGSLAAVVLVAVTIAYPVQSGPQGRWTLPLALTLPLMASVMLDHHRLGSTRWVQRFATLGIVVIGGIQVAALWTAARRNAVGATGPWWFIGESRWHPPLGWGPWVAAATVAAIMVALGAVHALGSRGSYRVVSA